MSNRSREQSILVVGAGPTGLAAAIELSRRGLHPRIIDKDDGPAAESRALGVNPRTLRVLEPCGATERLLAAGHQAERAHLHTAERELFELPISEVGGPYPFMLLLPQSETEKILIELLRERGIEVEWQTELTALDQEDGAVRAELTGPSGTERVTPDILIGADGAHSRVRHAIGVDFPGSAYETDFGLADVRVRSKLSPHDLHIFDLAPVLFAMIPIDGEVVRFISDHSNVLDHVPPQLAYDEVLWETTFRISHRQATTYQVGNIFLAGDAAHIHSPVGARGMNLGIEDAAWLAWLIDEGHTEEYTKDRWPVGRHVLKTVDPITRLMAADGAIPRFIRRQVLPVAFKASFARRKALERITGQDTRFPPWLMRGA